MDRIILSEGPLLGGCGEKEEIVGWLDFCFVFQKFALVCYYSISRKGRQSSEEIPTVRMQPSLDINIGGAGPVCVLSCQTPRARE